MQVGTFTSRANAERLSQQLARKGFSAYVASARRGGRELYRVRVGPAQGREAAGALGLRLRGAGHAGSVVPTT